MSGEKRTIRVATRKSPLAMRQTEMAVAALGDKCPCWSFEILPMSTTGDERLAWSLEASGGKGLFTSALEIAIIEEQADLAVHSAKDLPTEMTEGVALAGYLPRAAVNDVLILREAVQRPAVIATSSPRRRAQLKRFFPDAEWKEIRGNVHTRLGKLASGEADASVMAMAGLQRLGILSFEGLRFIPLPLTHSIPAAGQGAIGLQVRADEASLFAALLDKETAASVHLERAVLEEMGGGCHSATAVHAGNGRLYLYDERRGTRMVDIPSFVEGACRGEGAVRRWIREVVS